MAIRRVVGDSMLPSLHPGQLVLVRQWRVRPKLGRIVIIEHQGMHKIKRVSKLRPGAVYVLGDNPGRSTDSRTLGWLPASAVKAVVCYTRTKLAANIQAKVR